MAIITENVTVVTPTNYTLPEYRKVGANLYIKVYATNKMIVVCDLAGGEYIMVLPFPTVTTSTDQLDVNVPNIRETTASDVTEFGTAYTAVGTILAAL